MRFSEAEMTAALNGAAKATITAQSKDIRKGRVDVEQAWQDLGGYGRYQILEPLGAQILPILLALPDVPRVVGQRPSYKVSEISRVVDAHTEEGTGGRLRRKALVLARTALVQTALASIPPWSDPEKFVVPDSLEG